MVAGHCSAQGHDPQEAHLMDPPKICADLVNLIHHEKGCWSRSLYALDNLRHGAQLTGPPMAPYLSLSFMPPSEISQKFS